MKRSHLGQSRDPTKRSINLAISHRGLSALASVGLDKAVLDNSIPMPCRAIHPPPPPSSSSSPGSPPALPALDIQPYGQPGQAINSSSRSLLNTTLLDACDKLGNVSVYFRHKLVALSKDGASATFAPQGGKDGVAVAPSPPSLTRLARVVIGADGAYSATRECMMRISRMNFERRYIAHGYKELNMPPVPAAAGAGGGAVDFALPTPAKGGALHIWPRSDAGMMIALPNPDKSFTLTLFAPWPLLDALDASPEDVEPFFREHFPDALPLIPELKTQFQRNPSSALVMTRCDPWNVGGRAVVLGDAAHAVVPFYGQGANAAFEDCLVFCETLDACGGDAQATVREFARIRKPAGDAIGDLSLDNYIEMRHKTASSLFLLRQRIETMIQRFFPSSWIPLYGMVSFTRIPYEEVIVRARSQDRIVAAATATAVVAAAAAVGAATYYVVSTVRSPTRGAQIRRAFWGVTCTVLGWLGFAASHPPH